MSTYPPTRTLTRSRDDRVLAGVCGGLAKYAGFDPSIVRIVTVVISAFSGVGLVIYLVAALVIPEEGTGKSLWQQYNPLEKMTGGTRPAGFAPATDTNGTTQPAQPTRAADDPTDPNGPIYGSGATQNPDDLR